MGALKLNILLNLLYSKKNFGSQKVETKITNIIKTGIKILPSKINMWVK